VAHRLNGEPGTLEGDRRANDELYRGILQQAAPFVDAPYRRKTLDEVRQRDRLIARPESGALGADIKRASDHI
jgi:hypothetical protein